MEEREKDEASKLALVLLRSFKGWDQGRLARVIRIAPSQVSVYEQGRRSVPREVLEKVASAVDFPILLLDPLLRMIRSFLAASRGHARPDRVLADGFAMDLLIL